MSKIDLRSDTVTHPTPGMRQAMAAAEVGDDVYGEDPTVNRLQAVAAQKVGKEAALYVPSGTIANLCAILSHTRLGDEVIVESHSHTFNYESGGGAAVAGVQFRPIHGVRGVLPLEEVAASIHRIDHHFPPTRLIGVENTHNSAGGAIYPLDNLLELKAFADENGLKVHIDGARIWNASVASGVPVSKYAECADSISFCLSKGLGAPVGSLICGDAEFIDRCHRFRKMLGGGMRQAGILAAAGLFALEYHVDRLAEDHANAALLAKGLQSIEGLEVETPVETNMVFFRLKDARLKEDFLRKMKEDEILLTAGPGARIRAVTHLEISQEDIETTVDSARRACQ